MLIVSAFDGISVLRHALSSLNIEPEYYLSYEVDRYAIQVSQSRWNDVIEMGDVASFNVLDMPCKTDLLVGGSPCQGFSLQGLQKGLEDDRSKLIHYFFKMKKQLNPKYFLLENVYMKQETQDFISKQLGVSPILIDSRSFVPQSRKRLYWTNIPVAKVTQVDYNVLDLCPEGTKPGTCRKGNPRIVVETDIFKCLTASYYKGIRADGRPLLAKKFGEFDKIRDSVDKLPVELCEALQGLPKGYTEGISNTQRYKALGNSFTSDVIQHILKGIQR